VIGPTSHNAAGKSTIPCFGRSHEIERTLEPSIAHETQNHVESSGCEVRHRR